MQEKLIEVKKEIERFYRETENIDVTSININEVGALKIDYVEAVGGGFASVGDFEIDFNKLKEQMRNYFNKEVK